MTKHTFYIDLDSGESVWWTGLSYKKARDMHAYTNASQPSNVVGSGWFTEKEPTKLTNVSGWDDSDTTYQQEGASAYNRG